MTTALRPLSLGELLDRTFHLYRQHFVIFVGLAALPGLVQLAFSLLLISPRLEAGIVMSILIGVASVLVSIVVTAVSQAATITAVSELHLGRPISIKMALDAARSRIVEVVLASLLVGLYVTLGFLLLIVPGVIMALRWAIVIPIVVIEHLPIRASMARSSALTEGHRGRVFLIYLLFFVLMFVVGLVWQIPIGIAAVLNSSSPGAPPLWIPVVAQVGTFFTSCLVGPLASIAVSLFYYDERVRKEAFDLDHMISQIDSPSGSSPATA